MAPATALIVMQAQRQEALRSHAHTAGINLWFARDCDEARQALRTHPEICVVLSDVTLPDGNWWCIHKELQERAHHTELIVVLPRRGKDVREILSHGAFAVIAPPFRRAEIVSLISAASRRQARPGQKETECMLA